MNGEAGNSRFVSMYVYMYLAFKELNSMHLRCVFDGIINDKAL